MMCVERIMTRKTLVVAPDDDLEAVRALMDKHRVHHAPVLEDGELVGILSERDFRHCSAPAVVAAFMEEGVWVPPSASIREAALTMIQGEVGILPVVDDGTPVGIVTKTDLLRGLCDGGKTVMTDSTQGGNQTDHPRASGGEPASAKSPAGILLMVGTLVAVIAGGLRC